MTVQLTDFARYLEDQLAATRRESVARLGAKALAWLALPPVWTDALAAAASFPASPLDREKFLAECEALGWCTRRPAGATSRPDDAAEILVGILEALPATTTDIDIWPQVARAAVSAINQIQASALRRAMRDRLLELRPTSVDTTALVDSMALSLVPAPTERDPADAAGQLVSQHAWGELGALLRKVQPADLQRVVLPYVRDLPDTVLEPAVSRVTAECPPRVAARVLAAAAPALPPASVHRLVARVLPRIGDDKRGTEPALGNLAAASASAGDRDLALDLCERLSDDRRRAHALAVLAGTLASDPGRERPDDVVDRIARVIVAGEGVDLAGAADAVTRLASAGALAAASPIIAVARDRLDPRRLSAADVGALVKLAVTLREAGAGDDPDATIFASAAVEVAHALGDPAARAAALARVVPVVQDIRRPELTAEALRAARRVVDATDRARALARLVPHLPPQDLGPVVEELVASVQPVDAGSAFWAPDAARADILAELERQKGLPWLRGTAAAVGGAVLGPHPPGLVPSAMGRWVSLAATLDRDDEAGGKTGDALLKQVEPLLRSGVTAEALGWIETGRRLLAVLHGTFDTSLLVATRRVELVQRHADDRHLLRRFLARKEQVTAFRNLLGTPDGEEPWALHYLGHGGVGKTMLLRHVTAELAPAEQRITARVDFDHLNPDFPLRRPGQLLLDLLEELEVYADSDTRGLYEEARLFLRHLEWWTGGTGGALPTASAAPTLEEAVQRFCAYLQALGGRIVLVLDTCEELAKFQPTGGVLPQLDAAFRLLERINHEVPSVRVVFAGRRPLARKVHGDRPLDPRRSPDYLPAEKTYLDVHEIGGFTEDEARTYLSELEGLTLEETTIRELLDRSRDTRHDPYFATGLQEADIPRYAPFDLAQYAAALRDNPRYLRTVPRSGAYVRDRIVGRQGQLTAPLLPAVVAMRRFDRDMLGVVVQGTAVTSDEAWQELATTEWIGSHVDTTLRTTFLEVDRAMLERLEAYYRAEDQRAEYDRAHQQVADGLARLVYTRPLTELAVDHVDAALRCLPGDQAAALCDNLALRVAADGSAWMWAYNVFSRVLGPEGTLANALHPAAASASALHATALSRVKPTEDLQSQWQTIAEQAGQHPRQAVARWLRARAEVLAVPADTARWLRAMRLADELLAGDDEEDRRRGAWLIGTTLAAASRVVDAAAHDRRPTTAADWLPVAEHTIGQRFGPQVSAVAAVLLARGFLLDSDEHQALELFSQALAFADADPVGSRFVAETGADGAVPERPRDRVRLEAALAGLVDVDRIRWLSQALDRVAESTVAGRVADPDSDRLAALLLDQWLDEQQVPDDMLRRVQHAVGESAPPSATTLAHRRVPPLRVALSRGWLAHGDAIQARAALGAHGTFAESAAEQLLLDLARVEVARRLRLPDSDPAVRLKLRDSLSPMAAPRVYEAAALLGEGSPPRPALAEPPEKLHAWWRVEPSPLRVADSQELAAALHLAPRWCAPDQPYARVALALDAAELTQLSRSPSPELDRAIAALPLEEWYQRHPDHEENAWRLALRQEALTDPRTSGLLRLSPVGTVRLGAVPQPGPRRLAELALEEGELLALRLPEPGARLLGAAARWFDEVDDHAGRLIAQVAAGLADERSGHVAPVADLEASYRAAREVIADLPDWPHLQDEGRHPKTAPAVQPPTHPSWEGWLLRLYWLLARPSSPVRRDFDPRTTAIPPELRPVEPENKPGDGTPPSAPQREATTPRRAAEQLTTAYATQRARRRRWGRLILAGAATLAAAGAGFGLVLLYGWFAHAVGDLPVLRVPVLRISAYIAALLGVAWAGFRVADSGPRYSWARVTIEGGPKPNTASVAVMGWAVRRWPLPGKAHWAEVIVPIPGSTKPDPAMTLAHKALLATTHPAYSLRVSLHVARPLVGVAWEAWLAAPLGDRQTLRPGRPYRSALRSLSEPYHGESSYWVVAPLQWRRLVQAAVLPGRAAFPSRFPPAVPSDVLIIVATAVDTTAGRRLVVRQGASGDADMIIEPDDAALAGISVVVVGEPGGDGRRRSATDSAAALRACAADLVEAGAQTVVVVPSVPAVIASDVLTALAQTLRPGVYQFSDDLYGAVHEARKVLARDGDTQLSYELTVMSRMLF